ncbi:MAG TPA: sulfatase-like hydrolase/transferase [Chitinophagaceae bacterium]|nr:sulfatase-like hydrolase/transferase [Chitinophagaceae bacterium]
MFNTLKTFTRTKPLFLFLLPLFFVLHGYTGNYDFVPVKDALLLVAFYMGCGIVLALIFMLVYRNIPRACLAAFIVLAFHFFFGSFHDTLKKIAPGSLISKYAFVIPFYLVCLLIILFLVKRKKPSLLRSTYYLNGLLILFCLLDLGWLTTRIISQSKKNNQSIPEGMVACDTCARPDVFLIIADEYAGNHELKDILGFDNQAFLDSLTRKGFHLMRESYSNYQFTPISVSSILNMDYIDPDKREKGTSEMTYFYRKVRDNPFLRFLEHYDYRFYNYSYFDFKGQDAPSKESLMPSKTKLITSQTFLSRVDRDLRYYLVTFFHSKKEMKRLVYSSRSVNQDLFDRTLATAGEKTEQPKFVFTHLMMPHFQYYYDKNGKEFPYEQLVEGTQHLQKNYLEYLQYTNKKLLQLVDHIKETATKPPIILLMGDHGFRHFTQVIDTSYYFRNLMSVYLPSGKYEAFKPNLTAVNFLRALLNTEFGQHMPYLKDHKIFYHY